MKNDKLYKALCMLLPYKAKVQIDSKFWKYSEPPIVDLFGVSNDDPDPSTGVTKQIEILHNNDIDFRNFDEFKLCLFPLSMIDKPIIHNGEEVIPLIEVAKTSFKKLNEQEFCLLDGYVRLRGIFGDNRYTLHFDKKEVSFDARTRYKKSEGLWDEHIYVPNQFEGIQKLIELRLNVFGLEENEFIDASKVKCYE